MGARFLFEAGFILAAAVVAGIAGLSTWGIVGVAAAAWILVALVEVVLRRRRRARDQQPEPEPVRGVVPSQPAREAPPPASDPEPLATEAPTDEEPREWNLWELERVARENTTDDVATNEERAYLLMYLREFAGPDGTLPADFDGLVRDAFGDLLRVATL